MLVYRLLPDGSLDASFGDGGVARIDHRPIDYLFAVEVDAENRVIASGASGDLFDSDPGSHPLAVRLLEDGTLDSSFGSDGALTTTDAGQFNRIAIDREGRLLLAINRSVGQGQARPGVVRTDPDGHIDPTYSGGAPVDATGGYPIRSLAVDGRQRALVTLCDHQGFHVVRLDSGGEIDRTFGEQGEVTVRFGRSPGDCASGVIADSANRVIVGGSARAVHGRSSDFAVAWLKRDGTLDRRAGDHGTTLTDFGRTADRVNGLALADSGDIVAAGRALSNERRHQSDIVVARYQP
jgi:uncharacterized delta-60 repeat protein